MPAITITPHTDGFHLTYAGNWQYVSHRDSPAQQQGHAWPSNNDILMHAIAMYEHRRSGVYPASDAERAWFVGFGMIVEMDRAGVVRVKW